MQPLLGEVAQVEFAGLAAAMATWLAVVCVPWPGKVGLSGHCVPTGVAGLVARSVLWLRLIDWPRVFLHFLSAR